MIPDDCKPLKILSAWSKLSEPYPVVSDRMVVRVNNEIVTLARHEVQCGNRQGLDVADLGGDYRHIVIFDLHDERADVETGIDDPEAESFVGFNVENRQRRMCGGVCGLLKVEFKLM